MYNNTLLIQCSNYLQCSCQEGIKVNTVKYYMWRRGYITISCEASHPFKQQTVGVCHVIYWVWVWMIELLRTDTFWKETCDHCAGNDTLIKLVHQKNLKWMFYLLFWVEWFVFSSENVHLSRWYLPVRRGCVVSNGKMYGNCSVSLFVSIYLYLFIYIIFEKCSVHFVIYLCSVHDYDFVTKIKSFCPDSCLFYQWVCLWGQGQDEVTWCIHGETVFSLNRFLAFRAYMELHPLIF